MKSRPTLLLISYIMISVLTALCGCASTEPSRFYTLRSLGNAKATPQKSLTTRHVSIGVGPVEIPDYLDRPQIATRSSMNELRFAEFDRWAGSLRENISAVLAENISILLGTDRVFSYPWTPGIEIEYRISVNVLRLEGMPGGRVSLKALWTISGSKGKKEIVTRLSEISEQMSGSSYEEMVAAMSRVLDSLSLEIATEISGIK